LLKWARIFWCHNGILMPHRDYLDIEGGRLHPDSRGAANSHCYDWLLEIAELTGDSELVAETLDKRMFFIGR